MHMIHDKRHEQHKFINKLSKTSIRNEIYIVKMDRNSYVK